VPQPDPQNQAGYSKGNWDLRLYDVSVPLGKAELGFIYSTDQTGLDATGNQSSQQNGPSLNFVHTAENFLGPDSLNRLSLQAGWGAAMTFNSGFETFNTPAGSFIRPSMPGAWRFRATENLVLQPLERLAPGA
jgi:maltoporin